MHQSQRKPTKPARAADAETDLLDLDALVLAEIESLTAYRDAARARQATRSAAPTPVAEGAQPQPQPRVKASVAPIRTAAEPRPESFGEEAELLFQEPEPPLESQADDARAALLRAEDEAFITRAVGFLSQHPEADIILNRIWEQLTELDPEGYYQAPLDVPDETRRDARPESTAAEKTPATPPANPRED